MRETEAPDFSWASPILIFDPETDDDDNSGDDCGGGDDDDNGEEEFPNVKMKIRSCWL